MYICDRKLFGAGYRELIGNYFESMGKASVVMIYPFVKSSSIVSNLNFPGDIDLLIIPYEDNQLIVSKTLAIELKIIRAKFTKQAKSPNDFGFSQAIGLLKAGFPYVAVAHLIISDHSPKDYWREVGMAQVLNTDTGAAKWLGLSKKDMMPIDLMTRAYGRLKANCPNENIGLLASYIDKNNSGLWFPEGRAAQFNPESNINTLEQITEFYYRNYENFIDTRKWPKD
ncbi:hypothetical protein [Alkanindiges illinoisensis]|uniref:hypothetical protein n=1 Tax=Alkanindiges illinoisensis TaxID=197183 RepID=UPI000A8DD1E9|nr:hypothetical protein [Alkanindiges illinoisensis]